MKFWAEAMCLRKEFALLTSNRDWENCLQDIMRDTKLNTLFWNPHTRPPKILNKIKCNSMPMRWPVTFET